MKISQIETLSEVVNSDFGLTLRFKGGETSVFICVHKKPEAAYLSDFVFEGITFEKDKQYKITIEEAPTSNYVVGK